MTIEENTTKRRFYRSSLETIVWDPQADRPLADFSKGHFTTDDPRVADYLEALGYPEIPLDAVEPPNIIVRKPVHKIPDNVPIMGPGAQEGLFDAQFEKKVAPPQAIKDLPPPEVTTAPVDRPIAPPPPDPAVDETPAEVEAPKTRQAKPKAPAKKKAAAKPKAPKKSSPKRVASS